MYNFPYLTTSIKFENQEIISLLSGLEKAKREIKYLQKMSFVIYFAL